jgi:hypothetical protein
MVSPSLNLPKLGTFELSPIITKPAPRSLPPREVRETRKELNMAVVLSVLGALLLAGIAVSRLRAKMATKKDVQTLF